MASHPEVKALGEAIARQRPSVIVADGLCCSAAPLAFAALTRQASLPLPLCLFVLNDADEAGYFYHDLMQMSADADVLFFPSSYRRAIRHEQRDAANGILRTEVLGRVAADSPRRLFVVTYPEALAERVVAKQQLASGTMCLRQGSSIDFTTLEERLDQLGFTHVDYVYEPGQYAIRGSIVDVYSYASESPFRIDFFGDDVDSIRTFDVQTQLSDQPVPQAVIIPDIAQSADNLISIFDFLPSDTLLVTRDLTFVCERVEQISEEESPEAFRRNIAALRRVELSAAVSAATAPPQSGSTARTTGQVLISFHTSPQPLFHKNFEWLEHECHRLIADGYRLFILADSAKQIERLQDILGSFPSPIAFEPVQRTVHEGFIDHTLKLCLFTDHQIFDRFHKYNLKSDKARRGKAALTLREIQQFSIGDYVVHIDHGVGRFGGLVNVPAADGRGSQEMIKIVYQNEDTVYVSIHSLHKIAKYKGKEGEPPRVNKLGTGAWERMKERVKSKVKDIARDLIRLYSQRLRERGFAFSPDGSMQHELEASFLYEDTPDQLKATQEVKHDMEQPQPMDRLVCGDVGFGKTEVAVRAAFKAAADSKQVAVLVPTTVLAYQHYQTFSSRLKDFPVTVDYLSRARTPRELKDILARLADGRIDILIGTHKLIAPTVHFKDLGLLIIDEEQKFGVSVKEKLRQLKVNVDTLTMTATPIPRTLQFSLMGARDLSVIQTPPPNRHPIRTEIHTFSPDIIAEAIHFELSRNGQVFFVSNRISSLPALEALIHRAVPEARVCTAHGRMHPKEVEQTLLDFMNYDYDVLLSTTLVENGIDVPNANTIIINAAQHYGLSDLHQMRGRVGRSNQQAFCYLLAPPLADLPDDARRRLQAVETFAELGSGLNIAMQDLDIRGAGNLLGSEQSGFIADLGYDTYQKVLAEAMQELKNSPNDSATASAVTGDAAQPSREAGLLPFGDNGKVTWAETDVESDIPAYFAESYVPSSGERMSLYRELDSLTTSSQLEAYQARLIDRFGPVPSEAAELIRIVSLRLSASRLGIERLILKQGRMILYLVADRQSSYYQSTAFGDIIQYATRHARLCQFRDSQKPSILISDVHTIAQALHIISEMERLGTEKS